VKDLFDLIAVLAQTALFYHCCAKSGKCWWWYELQNLLFERQLNRSFLPEMIRLAKERGLRLIMVRQKTLRFSASLSEPPALPLYNHDLHTYLAQNDIPLVDFSSDVRLKANYLKDSVHMNTTGQAAFTQMAVEALEPLIK
jgi:lysophospholipase L1-like esterase